MNVRIYNLEPTDIGNDQQEIAISISGARTSVSADEMNDIINDLGIHPDEWAYLSSSDLATLIEEKSEGHYRFS